jgi:Fe-S-cluster formation regulator IscX/YfhJ
MGNLKRYDFRIDPIAVCSCDMVENITGDYVKFADIRDKIVEIVDYLERQETSFNNPLCRSIINKLLQFKAISTTG